MTGPADAFTSRAEKLRFLLQAPRGAEAELAGAYWARQRADFELAGFQVVEHGRPATAWYRFVSAGMAPFAGLAAGTPGPAGVVAAWAPPRWAAGHALRRQELAAARAGLAPGERFEVDGLQRWLDELRRVRDAAPPLVGWRARVGMLRHGRNPQLAFYGPGPRWGLPGLTVAATSAASMAGTKAVLEVDRMWFRRRGALVIRLAEPGSDRTLFLRVATSQPVDEVLRGNQEFVTRLLAHPELPALVRTQIPRQFGHRRAGDAEVYLEEGYPGQMVWTLESNRLLAAAIDRQLFEFTHELQRATGRAVVLDEGGAARWTSNFLGPLPDRLASLGLPAAVLEEVTRPMHRILTGRRWWLAPAHGDYGSGNALARADGRVTGIIDWDTHADDDLAGIDWCDHRLKALRFASRDWEVRLDLILDDARSSGWLAPDYRGFGEPDFGMDLAARTLVGCLASLRILTREARYPSTFVREPGYYQRWLESIARRLSGAAG